jgi:hypothetical protein
VVDDRRALEDGGAGLREFAATRFVERGEEGADVADEPVPGL